MENYENSNHSLKSNYPSIISKTEGTGVPGIQLLFLTLQLFLKPIT
jgi:hypothetical protein